MKYMLEIHDYNTYVHGLYCGLLLWERRYCTIDKATRTVADEYTQFHINL